MKNSIKIFLAAFWIISASSLIFSQAANDNNAVLDDGVFAPANEEFSVQSPPVALGVHGAVTGEKASRRYVGASGETYFYIFSDAAKNNFSVDAEETDVSAVASKMPAQYKVVLQFIKNSQATTAAKKVNVDNFAGEKYEFAGNGFFHKILILKTTRRVYVFQTVSASENSQDAESFFSSIKLNRRIDADTSALPEQKSNDGRLPFGVKIAEIKTATAAQTNANEQGTGGRGTSDGTQTAVGVSLSAAQTTPLTLQEKPKPPYTDFARFYEITGMVRVRVMFLSNGEIGSVAPITKLPFGLTEQAITAARAIKFSPAKRNGQPVVVSKLVEYQFTIY